MTLALSLKLKLARSRRGPCLHPLHGGCSLVESLQYTQDFPQ